MIPDSHAKSFLSKSYVNAVATQAGFGCQFVEPDYGVDARISEIRVLPSGRYVDCGLHFTVQIKASHNYLKTANEIVYSLDADAYERLICHDGGLIVLILFCVPKELDCRVHLSEDRLELRNCCYWYRVTGQDKKTLHIPRVQVFAPDVCKDLMICARNREW